MESASPRTRRAIEDLKCYLGQVCDIIFGNQALVGTKRTESTNWYIEVNCSGR